MKKAFKIVKKILWIYILLSIAVYCICGFNWVSDVLFAAIFESIQSKGIAFQLCILILLIEITFMGGVLGIAIFIWEYTHKNEEESEE